MNPRASYPTYTLSRGASSPLEYFSKGDYYKIFVQRYASNDLFFWRRGWDSNPRYLSVSLVFKTSSLNRSDTSPQIFYFPVVCDDIYFIIYKFFCQHFSSTFLWYLLHTKKERTRRSFNLLYFASAPLNNSKAFAFKSFKLLFLNINRFIQWLVCHKYS